METPQTDTSRMVERERMVEQQLIERGIRDTLVLRAMRSVPRELFIGTDRSLSAYADTALPIECRQTISQPYIVARMTEALELSPTDRVLEIGAGSGYQTAVLAGLCAEVVAIERHPELLEQARRRLAQLGITNVRWRCGDGSLGWSEHAPYDAILVAAGAPEIPGALIDQLAPNGRLVIPVGPHEDQNLVRVRIAPEGIRREELLPVRFVPLIGEAGWPE